jgi:hypothetical protein
MSCLASICGFRYFISGARLCSDKRSRWPVVFEGALSDGAAQELASLAGTTRFIRERIIV